MPKHSMTDSRLWATGIRTNSDEEMNDLLDRVHNNLNIGDLLTYSQIIKKIGVPSAVGNAKKSQLKQFTRLFGYEKIKSSYLITDIYKEVQPKPERKQRSDEIYSTRLQSIMLYYLMQQEGVSVSHTKKMWWYLLGMVGQGYISYYPKDKREELVSLKEELDRDNVDFFYKEVNKRFTTLFNRVLDRLEKRRVINYRNVYQIKRDNESDFRTANEYEESELIDIEKQALKDMGFKDIRQLYVFPDPLFEEYYTIVNKRYKDSGYQFVSKEIEIVFGKGFLKQEYEESQEKLYFLVKQSNDLFSQNIINYTNTIYKNHKDKIKPLKVHVDGATLENFLDNQLFLTDQLLNKRLAGLNVTQSVQKERNIEDD